MIIKMRGQTYRTKLSTPQWLQIAKDYKSGMNPVDIAKKYINPQTKKQYSVNYIYWVLKRVQTL